MSALILIAEDTPDILTLLIEVLESEGYRVHSASDGKSAFDYLTNCIKCPDLIITDIMMPRMTGIELVDKVKADDKLCKIPVVVYSASTQFKKQVTDKGCHFAEKPFDMDQLIKLVQSLIPEEV